MRYRRRMSTICVCGVTKENPQRRYCKRCGFSHGQMMHAAHVGKGRGKRHRQSKKPFAAPGAVSYRPGLSRPGSARRT